MKIVILRDVIFEGKGMAKAGDIIDVNEATAERLISAKFATPYSLSEKELALRRRPRRTAEVKAVKKRKK